MRKMHFPLKRKEVQPNHHICRFTVYTTQCLTVLQEHHVHTQPALFLYPLFYVSTVYMFADPTMNMVMCNVAIMTSDNPKMILSMSLGPSPASHTCACWL